MDIYKMDNLFIQIVHKTMNYNKMIVYLLDLEKIKLL